jgi:hypothetical protein
MNSGLQDLYGLISFLKVEPYDSEQWWRAAIQKPYEQMSLAGRFHRPQFAHMPLAAEGGITSHSHHSVQ